MGSGAMLLNKVLERRLRRADIRLILDTLCRDDREEFLDELSEVFRKLITLTEVSNRLCDSLSIDLLLTRLLDVTADALDAERSAVFFNDPDTNELYSRIASTNLIEEIRIPNHIGIVGAVFSTARSINVDDAYLDSRFNPEMDKRTGSITRNILAAVIRNKNGDKIGVIEALNKKGGSFSESDRLMLETIGSQAAAALQNGQLHERVVRARHEESRLFQQMSKARQEEAEFFRIASDLYGELRLDGLFEAITNAAVALVPSERAVLYLHDENTNELWSMSSHEAQTVRLSFPSHLGFAGDAFTTRKTINIPDISQVSSPFIPIDVEPAHRVRSMLCVPVKSRYGKVVGVIQVRNRKGGPFTRTDENRIEAFATHASVALMNAQLHEAALKSSDCYESLFQAIPVGLIVLDGNRRVENFNEACLLLLGLKRETIAGRHIDEMFRGNTKCMANAVETVVQSGKADIGMYARLTMQNGETVALNLSIVPFFEESAKLTGSLLIFEPLPTGKTFLTSSFLRKRKPSSRHLPLSTVVATGG